MKSDKRAENLRAKGNRFYCEKKFFDALLKYNESLCNAEDGSEQFGLSYANRSAVYFEMKFYEKSLRNIQLARDHNYPQKNFEVLKKREEKCIEMIKNRNWDFKASEDSTFFKLSYPSNKKIPFIANCLELRINEKYGRHIITNQSLKTGDIVAIEEPTYKVIKADSRYNTCHDSNRYQRCANCLIDNLLDLIPCLNCCSTMFCSINCKNSAHDRYHKYECSIIDEILISGIKQIVLRMFFEALTLTNGSVTELQNLMNNNDGNFPTAFDINSNDPTNKFLTTIGLATTSNQNHETNSFEDIFMKNETLKKIWKENGAFTYEVFQKLTIIGHHYVHGIGGWSRNINGPDDHITAVSPSQHQQLIGNGSYLFSSLLNHSCAPNIKRLNVDDKVVIIISRPILKGEQLFDSYRENFNISSTLKRQEILMQDYGFLCDCEACSEDWPLNKNLESFDEDLLEFAWNIHSEIPKLTKQKLFTTLKNCFKLINQNHEKYPSAELVILQECISQCLIAITKPEHQFP